MEQIVVPSLLLCVIEMVVIAYLYHQVRTLRQSLSVAKTNTEQTYAMLPTLPQPRIQYAPDEQQEVIPQQQDVAPVCTVMNEYDMRFLERLRNIISEDMVHGKVDVETLASRMCISRSQLNRRVKVLTGMSTSNYSIQLRLKYACEQLVNEPETSVNVIALHCGFDDAAYFARIFKQRIGLPPSAFRKNMNVKEQIKTVTNEQNKAD